MAFQPEEELTCLVCLDIFKEPVVLSCSHSFCKDCLKNWWRDKPTQECPVCNRRSSMSDPPLNLNLRNLCEAFVQQREQKTPEEQECRVHSERLKLFCLTDCQPVCVVCRDSAAHANHSCKPIEEVTKDLREKLCESLNPLKDRLHIVERFKENCEFTLDHIETQSCHIANLIEKEFLKLHSFLSEQQEVRMKALKEEEEQKTQRMKDKMAAVSREIEALSESISATEEQLTAPDVSFLLKYKAAVERVQRCPLLEEEPQQEPEVLIDQAKHLGNLTFNIWTDMKRLVQFTPVILDPNTAHPDLLLSNDLTSFTCVDVQALPRNPERDLDSTVVRGSEGFDSGSHSWDVDVADGGHWELGVVTKSAYHMTVTDEVIDDDAGWWSLQFSDGQYRAFNINKKKESVLKLKSHPLKIRLHLECSRRSLTFYDADTNACIHSFTQLYQQKLFPVFGGVNHLLISILPQKI